MVAVLKIKKELYKKETLLKTIYNFQAHCEIVLDSDFESYIVKITQLNNKVFNKSEFYNYLNEQELRESLCSQFGKLRDKIYEKAFSIVE